MELLMADKALVFGRLKHSLELLAAPPDMQLRVVPAFGYRAHELYLGFDHWRMKVLGNFLSELAADQISSLNSLQETFTMMGHACWTDRGLADSDEWQHIRHLSSKALEAFGWLCQSSRKAS
jgi:hypothetical protein